MNLFCYHGLRKQMEGKRLVDVLTAAEQVAFKCNWGLADNLIVSTI